MSQNTGAYAPGTYVKGDRSKVAETASDAVALVFQGYRPVVEADVAYRDLQAAAKQLGIPANQSAEALKEALANPASGDADGGPDAAATVIETPDTIN